MNLVIAQARNSECNDVSRWLAPPGQERPPQRSTHHFNSSAVRRLDGELRGLTLDNNEIPLQV